MIFLKHILFFLASVALGVSCCDRHNTVSVIIPQPASQVVGEGYFILSGKTALHSNLNKESNGWLIDALLPIPLDISDISSNDGATNIVEVLLAQGDFVIPGTYSLDITPKGITIKAGDESGLFYGIQSLQQLYDEYGAAVPVLSIADNPRFAYRGLLIDSSRKFFSVGFIKKQIEHMSRYKLNRFIWYLGGEGGWRFNVDKSPQLTGKTSRRTVEDFTEWKESGSYFCSAGTEGSYGGYYTDEEIREVIEFARRKFVEVIPAVDIPCSHRGLSYALGEDVCLKGESSGADISETVLCNILDKMAVLFDSPSVYIGDGRADADRGVACPTCRPRIEPDKAPKDDEPFAVTIRGAEQYLQGRNKELLSYEESIRAGASGETTIICWHDRNDGLKAAETGRNVIMAPADYFSLDYYQNDPMDHPEAMSGFLPLDKVYGFNPIDADHEFAQHVVGIQASLWSGYTETPCEAEYMIWPRLMAVAEVGWSAPQRKSYLDFRRRAEKASIVIRRKGCHVFDITKERTVRPESEIPVNSLASGKKVIYHTGFDPKYAAGGKAALTDGMCGNWSIDDGRWQGFQVSDIDVTVDLGESTVIHSVSAVFMQDYAGKIWLPNDVEIRISENGNDFRTLANVENELQPDKRGYFLAPFGWKGSAEARYVRYTAKSNKRRGGWMFTDEIIIQ